MTTSTDFTRDATTKSGQTAKHNTRQKPLHILREHSSNLWSRKHDALRYNWMELAGTKAPTLQMLLEEKALHPELPARFIGVDKSQTVIEGCKEHYEEGTAATWVQGHLIPHRRDSAAYQNVGILVYDSFRAVRGTGTLHQDLPVLARFAERQYERLGEFLLVLNVAKRWVDKDEDVAHFKARVADLLQLDPETVDLHQYTSKKTPMLWTAIRLGF